MSAAACRFDVTSERCADCPMLGDCADEHLPPLTLPEPRTDAPLKVITRHALSVPRSARIDRRRFV